jgi:hypothetical protein
VRLFILHPRIKNPAKAGLSTRIVVVSTKLFLSLLARLLVALLATLARLLCLLATLLTALVLLAALVRIVH